MHLALKLYIILFKELLHHILEVFLISIESDPLRYRRGWIIKAESVATSEELNKIDAIRVFLGNQGIQEGPPHCEVAGKLGKGAV